VFRCINSALKLKRAPVSFRRPSQDIKLQTAAGDSDIVIFNDSANPHVLSYDDHQLFMEELNRFTTYKGDDRSIRL